jgi:hypothetical protein
MSSEEQDIRRAWGLGVAEAGVAPRKKVAQPRDTARQRKAKRFIADSLQFHGLDIEKKRAKARGDQLDDLEPTIRKKFARRHREGARAALKRQQPDACGQQN